jgi:hypothetical protein
VDNEFDRIREVLRRLPAPEPRAGFVDAALARATNRSRVPRRVRRGTWWGMAIGALAAAIALVAFYPRWVERAGEPTVGLLLDEARDIAVVIDSERELPEATIRVYVSGGIELAGFGEQRELQWVATLTRGSNLLTLPVVARAPGAGQVVAEIEHDGRTKRAIVAVQVREEAHQRTEVEHALPDGIA